MKLQDFLVLKKDVSLIMVFQRSLVSSELVCNHNQVGGIHVVFERFPYSQCLS